MRDDLLLFRRRTLLLGGLQAAALTVLGARLYQLQVLEGERYHLEAEDNRIKLQPLVPPRGLIVDRFNQPLADNLSAYRLLAMPLEVDDLPKRLQQMVRAGYLTLDEVEAALEQLARQRKFLPLILKANLTWDEMAQMELRIPEHPGFRVEAALQRFYPLGPAAAHIIGYVGRPDKDDVRRDPVLKIPDMRTGKNGIERRDEETLKGIPGQQQTEVMVNGRPVRELGTTPPTPGEPVQLSIDADLQRFLYDRFGEESGSAVVMDVETGEVLAIVSVPAFDPHSFINGIPSKLWKELTGNPRAPLLNKPLQALYPPASTFKMVTGLAALRAGVTNPSETVFCPGVYALGGARFHCWKPGGHGSVNMERAIAHSCDVYFYEMTRRMGIEALAETARDIGLGSPTGIELAGEKGGIVPDPAWKMQRFKQPWHPGETIIAGIGQGYLLATGRSVKPTLHRIRTGMAVEAPPLPFKTAHLPLIHKGMWDVVNAPWGTAYAMRPLKQFGIVAAGKTGTAQVRRISASERASGIRKGNALPWHLRNHGMYVTFFPFDKPRYAAAVVVDHGEGGSKAAAPIARDIVREMYRKYFS